MSTRARGEGVKGMGVYDCWGPGVRGCYLCLFYIVTK